MEFPCLIRDFLVKRLKLEHHYLLTPFAYSADFLSFCLSECSPLNYIFPLPISIFALLNISVSNNLPKIGISIIWMNTMSGILSGLFDLVRFLFYRVKLIFICNKLNCFTIKWALVSQNNLNCLARNTIYIFCSISIVNIFIQTLKYLVQSNNEQ